MFQNILLQFLWNQYAMCIAIPPIVERMIHMHQSSSVTIRKMIVERVQGLAQAIHRSWIPQINHFSKLVHFPIMADHLG